MIDLHIHTIHSDGSKTVEEILEQCEQKKLEYISITDHNSCGAYYEEVLKNNKIFSGTIIKGCELNAEFQKRGIKILGYNINPDIIMEWKEKYYSPEVLKENTKQIYDKFLRILESKGIIYNESDIRPQIDEKELIERPIWEEIFKHEENKEIIGEQYWVKSFGPFGRSQLLNPNSEYYLGRAEFYPKAKEVVDIIHKAGGKAFLAHPFEYKFEDTIRFIDDLRKEVKLDGIECFHPSANEENMKILVDYARKNNLYISGGSDYHGGLKPDIEIAVGKGNLNISKDFILEWVKE